MLRGLFEDRGASLIQVMRLKMPGAPVPQEMVPGPLLDFWPESLQQKMELVPNL